MTKAVSMKAIALLAGLTGAVEGKAFSLVQSGKSNFTIVSPKEATPAEKHAAEEFQAYIEDISGAKLPIVTEDSAPEGPKVFVGPCKALSKLGLRLEDYEFGSEGFVMAVTEGNLVLAGGRPRGTLYAVYTFLEEKLGCRWFAPGVERVPKMHTIALKPFFEVQKPAFEYREPFFFHAFDGDWAARNKANGHAARLTEKHGGKISFFPFVHTFHEIIPPENFFKEHPEYFAEIGGQRRWERAQICLSNPEVLRIAIETVKRWIKEHPKTAIFSVSQEDWGGWCQCQKCRAIDEREGSPAGSIIKFVNAISEEIVKEHPDKFIDTLAYTYSERPPLFLRPHRNVIVRLCRMLHCDAHPIDACPVNRVFYENLKGWCEISPKVYIWDYVVDFSHYIMPFPNFYAIARNIRIYRDIGVKGLFPQGCYDTPGGEFAELRAYVLAKLLWNPDRDVDELVDEFLQSYYGRAWRPIRKYFDLIHERAKNPEAHFHLYSPPQHMMKVGILMPEVLAEADRLFDEAERLVESEEVRKRVRIARMPVDYVYLSVPGKFVVKEEKLVPERAAELRRRLERFVEAARGAKVKKISEVRPFDDWLKWIENQLRGHKILTLQSERLEVPVIPSLGGRLFKLVDKRRGRDLLRLPEPGEPGYPASGGYEEYSGRDYRSPGWREEFEVIEKGPNFLVLRAKLENGLLLERRIEAVEDGEVKISSKLTNTTKGPLEAALRAHPEFSLGEVQDVSVFVKTANGWRRISLSEEMKKRKPAMEGEWEFGLEGEEKPLGAWLAFNEKLGVGLLVEFDPSQVEVCWLNWNAPKRRVNLELWCPRTTLEPGGAMLLRQRWLVVDSVRPFVPE